VGNRISQTKDGELAIYSYNSTTYRLKPAISTAGKSPPPPAGERVQKLHTGFLLPPAFTASPVPTGPGELSLNQGA